MQTRKLSRIRGSRGQSLVETALMIPLLLLLILNAVNVGYFFLVTLNLTSATRTGIEYAIEGSSTPSNASLPTVTGSSATTVSSLISAELGSFNAGTLQVQICSLNLGSTTASPPVSNCQTANGGSFPSPDPDPEWSTSPGFALNRVDVSYKFNTLIPATPFNLIVASFPTCSSNSGSVSCTFVRHAEMRAMGS
jgi:Flp pilus assembly protein TadG